jgi:predicted permease
VDASRIAIVALLPLGFFAVGAALAEEGEGGTIPIPPPLDAAVAAAVGLRLVVAPALLFLIALPLIDLPDPYLLLAAMPCGINTMIVSHAYGLDLRISAGAVAGSTAIAVVVAVAFAGPLATEATAAIVWGWSQVSRHSARSKCAGADRRR